MGAVREKVREIQIVFQVFCKIFELLLVTAPKRAKKRLEAVCEKVKEGSEGVKEIKE